MYYEYFKSTCDTIYQITNIGKCIYRYNLVFYIIYILLVKRNYIEAIFILYNLLK